MSTSPNRRHTAVTLVLLFIGLQAASPLQDRHFKLGQQLEIVASVLKELYRYMDPVAVHAAVKTGLDAMLKALDPYAQFVAEDASSLQDIIVGGQSGIGAVVDMRQGKPTVMALHKDYPAHKGGLRVGDVLTHINSELVQGKSIDQIRHMLCGMPDTTAQMTVERPLLRTPVTVTLIREDVRPRSVSHFSKLPGNIGYLWLERFMPQAADEVRDALDKLQTEGARKLVLDMRGNPGGVLEEAVKVTNLFIEQGLTIVSTQSRVEALTEVYTAEQPAYNTHIPIVVLIDSQSASCAEIVAGVLQDYDRAVLMGRSTFGKGLVQITTPLCYDTQLTLTAARYYMPSGRRIFKASRPDDTTTTTASFTTRAGRPVHEGEGIVPDVVQHKRVLAPVTHGLITHGLIFDYATLFRTQYERIVSPAAFALSDAHYGAFVNWLQDKAYPYSVEQDLEELQQKMHHEAYTKEVRKHIDVLRTKLQSRKQDDLQRHAAEIKLVLQDAILQRYYHQAGAAEAMLKHDRAVQSACALLQDMQQYRRLLQRQP